MCGLFGAILEDERQIVRAREARDALTHRGPDQAGEWLCGSVYMGHRRLSILDLSESGRQPMVSEDGQIGISVNGEIYNFKELRTELEAAGFRFRSTSDSEIVLHGYRHWGLDGLAERMDGMYVAVIFDRTTENLHAIRDRVGIKPLYYYANGKNFAWGSELKALKHWLLDNQKTLDETALYDFLTYRFIPAPKSLYKNVFKLPPAHLLTLNVRDYRLETRRYWRLPICERHEPNTRLAEELAALLRESVKEQLVSDVPIGFLLSGGIDSSAVTLTGAALSAHPMSFSIGFSDPARDESPYAQIIADIGKTTHRAHILDADEMNDLPARMAAWFDEPFADTSAVPTYRVCAFARQHVTVALSGDGGDELFGGYRWYDAYARLRDNGMIRPLLPHLGIDLPARLPHRRALMLASIGDPLAQYARLRGGLENKKRLLWREKLGVPSDYDWLWAYRAYFRPEMSARKAAQVMDFHLYLPEDILTKVDRVSMAVALECRPPFLSKKLVEFAFSLPEDFIYENGALKGGMKRAFASLLPPKILERDKQGFSVPDFGWRASMAHEAGSVQEALLAPYLITEGL